MIVLTIVKWLMQLPILLADVQIFDINELSNILLTHSELTWKRKERIYVRTYAVERSNPCSSAIHRRRAQFLTLDESGPYSKALGF